MEEVESSPSSPESAPAAFASIFLIMTFMVPSISSIILFIASRLRLFWSMALVSIWALAELIMAILLSHSCSKPLWDEDSVGVVGSGWVGFMQVERSATA